MRLGGAIAISIMLITVSAEAALTPATIPSLASGDCADPGETDTASCAPTADDEIAITAELLFAAMGPAAVSFAAERAARHASDNEPDAAELWRRIAEAAAVLIARGRILSPAE